MLITNKLNIKIKFYKKVLYFIRVVSTYRNTIFQQRLLTLTENNIILHRAISVFKNHASLLKYHCAAAIYTEGNSLRGTINSFSFNMFSKGFIVIAVKVVPLYIFKRTFLFLYRYPFADIKGKALFLLRVT